MYDLVQITADITAAAEEASKAILHIYQQSSQPQVHLKTDGSPVTAADMASHHIIEDILKNKYPDIPFISEENHPGQDFSAARDFFLVDPLDGTKGFIRQNGEFTVNIAYIHDLKPVCGVVISPALNLSVSGTTGHGIWINKRFYAPEAAKGIPLRNNIAMTSHHPEPAEWQQALLKKHNIRNTVLCHGSLKFCRFITEPFIRAAILPHPTYEWDIAAMDAILGVAGIQFFDANGQPVIYGKEKLLNPLIVAY